MDKKIILQVQTFIKKPGKKYGIWELNLLTLFTK
jgi:hypothetical protein